MTLYPWHETYRQRILRQYENNQLAHAILFSGPEDLGKSELAIGLSSLFLCTTSSGPSACGNCRGCHLLKAGTHPDFRRVQPEESKQIKIEQIRDLIHWVNQTAQRNGLKIAIISPAQKMNHQSANALLKCLEEPASNTLIFLVTPHPGSLLPTIRSRCQQYVFTNPDEQIALDWMRSRATPVADPELMLAIAGGAPLAAVNRFDKDFLKRRKLVMGVLQGVLLKRLNPTNSASKLVKQEPEETCLIFLDVIVDCIKYKLAGNTQYLKNKDKTAEIVQIVEVCSALSLFFAYDRVSADLKALRSTSNPNKTLLLENLLIDLANDQIQQSGALNAGISL